MGFFQPFFLDLPQKAELLLSGQCERQEPDTHQQELQAQAFFKAYSRPSARRHQYHTIHAQAGDALCLTAVLQDTASPMLVLGRGMYNCLHTVRNGAFCEKAVQYYLIMPFGEFVGTTWG